MDVFLVHKGIIQQAKRPWIRLILHFLTSYEMANELQFKSDDKHGFV